VTSNGRPGGLLNRDLERDLAEQGLRHLDPALASRTTLGHPDEPVLLQDPEVLLNVLEISLQRRRTCVSRTTRSAGSSEGLANHGRNERFREIPTSAPSSFDQSI